MLRNPKEPKETQRKEFLAIRKVSPRAAAAYGRQLKKTLSSTEYVAGEVTFIKVIFSKSSNRKHSSFGKYLY